MNIIDKEKPEGVIVQFGGQTPLNLTLPLARAGVKILGTSPDSIDISENRQRFGKLLKELDILHPKWGSARSYDEVLKIAKEVGYPVMARPSYVLGGRGMQIVYDEAMLEQYVAKHANISPEHPILIDRFLDSAKEVDVDALCDGKNFYIGGIMEHIEEAGIHSGDSACILPAQTLSKDIIKSIKAITKNLALKLQIQGLINIQYAVQDNKVYLLEANPRASRTVPFVSKATGIPIAKIAAKLMVGRSLKDLVKGADPENLPYISVKEAVLPWARFPGCDARLSPEMHSTGEVMGIDVSLPIAFYKSQIADGSNVPLEGAILFSLADPDKPKCLSIAKSLAKVGYKMYATQGTYTYFKQNGIDVEEVKKIGEGRPHVVDFIKNRKVHMVVNTPGQNETARSDGNMIRTTAFQFHVPIITTFPALEALKDSILKLKESDSLLSVRSLQDYYKSIIKKSA
jgi:carbamoyl-phosphate synthase large subunit